MRDGWLREKNLQFDEHTTQSTIKIPQITKQFTTLQLCCFHPNALIPLLALDWQSHCPKYVYYMEWWSVNDRPSAFLAQQWPSLQLSSPNPSNLSTTEPVNQPTRIDEMWELALVLSDSSRVPTSHQQVSPSAGHGSLVSLLSSGKSFILITLR